MSLYQPHETRVIDEKIGLDEKRSKLSAFIGNPESGFELLHKEDKELLREQLKAMSTYSAVLAKRIARFKRRMLSLPVIDMPALTGAAVESAGAKGGAR